MEQKTLFMISNIEISRLLDIKDLYNTYIIM